MFRTTAIGVVTAPVIGLWTVGAWSDGLPTNLLLKCEGKVSIVTTGDHPIIHDMKFETILRLKDGELSDIDSISLTTKGCELRNNTVHCSAKSVGPTRSGSERRELESYIYRETGEYKLFLITSFYRGCGDPDIGLT